MKIALVSSKDAVVGVVPKIAEKLRGKIFGVQVTQKISDSSLDIVKDILKFKKFDWVVVVLHYAKEGADIPVLMDKLVEFDLKSRSTMKFLRHGEDFDEDEEAESISSEILLKLFGSKGTAGHGGHGSFKGL